MEFLQYVLVGTLVFTGIIVGLVAILMIAKRQLVAEGEVALNINDDPDKSVAVEPGQSLLSALSSAKIFIPSACGGGGTCAQCKCVVLDGGGDVLPTEVGQLSIKERKAHVRLACQVKVKQDMKLHLEEEIFGIKKFECVVRSNRNVATFIKELILELDEPMDFKPGGYIQIDVPIYKMSYREFDIGSEYCDDWDKWKLWDLVASNDEEGFYRAYSMANYPAEGSIVMLNVRVATPPWGMDVPPGRCSSYIFGLKAGDKVTVSGPYGEFFVQETDREMCYIGGGAGMAPLRSHIYHLFKTLETGRKVTYWYGARSMREMFYWDKLKELEDRFDNFSFHLALSEPLEEDEWEGPVGFIHQVLHDSYLADHEAPEDIEYYICGPPLMFKAVRNLLYEMGVPEEMVRYDDFG